MDDHEFLASLDYVLLCLLLWHIKVYHFLYRFITLLHLITSFSLTRSLLVPYAHVFIESIDWILLSSFELNAILLISSVKTLCLSLLNLYFVFNIDLLFLMNYFLRLSMSIWFFSRWFVLFSVWVASKQFL